YNALKTRNYLLKKYSKLILVISTINQPMGMLYGFEDFCAEYSFDHEVIEYFNTREAKKGEVYIIPEDRDLVRIIKNAKKNKLAIGKDLGIISYNDTPLKEVVENGVTTISTDFIGMGKLLAEMVLSNAISRIKNNSSLIIRDTL
ncbi:MAG: substrate-binding domain-containing protein, partial [Lutibacter sp.]|nr:substrate-binding domain-containing protein [Lutibacter sp.]